MNLNELNELDLGNIGNWPLAAKVLLVAAVCALVAGSAYWFDTSHQIESLEKVQAEEKTLKTRVKVRANKAANLDALKAQLKELELAFSKLKRQLPRESEVAELLVDISQTGLASGLEFELFKPQPEIPKEFYAELPIHLRVTGDYHEFGHFVSGVAALPRIVTLHNIKIEPRPNNKLVMNATAKTYRYLEEEEEARK